MKKAALLTFLAVALALPTLAQDENRHQSYISYDDGGTVVRGEDGQEADAHRNLPVYPGDEIVTARRGRAEIRLSDGNIVGLDRATALRLRSILDAYEGDSDETVAELKYGKVAIHRTDLGRQHVRLDTENASYLAENEAVYSVETDSRGRDRVTVFDGSVEVRTPSRSTRMRRGESATVDDSGVYDLIGDQRYAADDFERWFLKRAERFGSYNNRYMDRRLSYWADDLDDHGRWVYVTGIGWSWRPFVSVGWRPYYNGYWHYSRNGCLTWVSHDPWGWGTYHYGRWAYDPGFGWIWVPGLGYAPAWVYWWYGSGYVGWAPAGWWDCYRPYYNWAYRPYGHYYGRPGYGFYGRVRISDIDLRPWTFVDSRGVISTRIDRAALTTDAVKQRLARSRDGYATVGGGNARFTRDEWNDPADVIRRRGLDGRATGRETGAPPTDMTPFFRRDSDVSGSLRDRVLRARGGSPGQQAGGGGSTGSVAPIGSGSVAPIGRGSVAPITPGSPTEGRRGGDTVGRVPRGTTPSQPGDSGSSSGSTTGRGGINRDRGDSGSQPQEGDSGRSSTGWRDRGRDRTPEIGQTTPSAGSAPSTGSEPAASAPSNDRPRNDSWRGRPSNNGGSTSGSSGRSGGTASSGGSSDVPRRVIDRIGGSRIRPRDDGSSQGGSSSSGSASSGSSSGNRDRGSSTRDSGRSSSGSRDSGRVNNGGSSSSGSRDSGRASSGSSSSGSQDSGRSSQPRSESSGGSKEDSGGRVRRD